ncbi:MAG: LysR family transcriptional regulator [Clostridia bacterium]|nr:LysR family transcriptional regulator [Clostridia bacterium]
MNLMQLRYFQAVCKFQTVSEAAESLYISQPSLSNAIKDLESEFGVTLFRRHHRGMTLTAEGEVLYRASKDILDRSEQIENIMKDLGKERKKLRLGVPPMIGSLILPYIYGNFLSENADITLEMVECGRQELVKKLDEEILDMVFLPHTKPFEPKLAATQIARLEIVCCATKDNPVSLYTSVKPTDLKNTPLVLFENSFFQTEEIKKWFAREEVTPNVLLQTEQLSTMLSMISNNIALGFMFRQLIEKQPNLIPVSIQTPIYVNVSLVWKKDAYFFSSMKRFKEYLTDKNPFNY